MLFRSITDKLTVNIAGMQEKTFTERPTDDSTALVPTNNTQTDTHAMSSPLLVHPCINRWGGSYGDEYDEYEDYADGFFGPPQGFDPRHGLECFGLGGLLGGSFGLGSSGYTCEGFHGPAFSGSFGSGSRLGASGGPVGDRNPLDMFGRGEFAGYGTYGGDRKSTV